MFRSTEALVSYLGDPARMLEDVRAFEEEIRAREGGRWAVGVNSATSGLVASLLALGVHSGDEVIVPALSWGQTWTGALILGCRVVPVDLAKDWPVMDPKGVVAAISPRTRAVVSVGLWGSPAGLAEVDAVCRRRGVPHVVDAAQLLGTRLSGQKNGGQRIVEHAKSRHSDEYRSPENCNLVKKLVSSLRRNDEMGGIKATKAIRNCVKIGEAGDLVVLSLGPSKSFSCGDGGVVLVREDAVLRDRLLWLTQHPYRVHSEAEDEGLIESARDGIGLNLRIHPLAARAGLRMLKSRRGALGGLSTSVRGLHSAGASPATQEEPYPMVAQAFLPVRTDRNVCPTGVNLLADRANGAEKYYNDDIPGSPRNAEGSEIHWIPDNDLGNDGNIRRRVRARRRAVEEAAVRYSLRRLHHPARFKPVRGQNDKVLFDARGVAPHDREAFREAVSGFAISLPCTYRPLSALTIWRRRSFPPWAAGPVRLPRQQNKQTPQASRWASDIEIVSLPYVPHGDAAATKEVK